MTSFEQQSGLSYRRARDAHGVRRRGKKHTKTSYKHVPHSEKPAHVVAKRNARERRRVETVNNAFVRLRRHVPFDNKHKRLSKVKTLRYAIDYIKRLTELINNHDRQFGAPCCSFGRSVSMAMVPAQNDGPEVLYRSRDVNIDTAFSYDNWLNTCS